MRDGVLIIYDLPEGDVEDMHVDFKLYKGDECMVMEYGAPIRDLSYLKRLLIGETDE